MQILKDLCKWKGEEIIEGKAMVVHIQLLVSIPPKISVLSFMGYLKGKGALMILDRHAGLKYKCCIASLASCVCTWHYFPLRPRSPA